jgi:signal transduction histidine kinase
VKAKTFSFITFTILFLTVQNLCGSIEKVDSINSQFNYKYIVSNTGKAIQIFLDNVELSKSLQYQRGLAKSYSMLGLAYYINGKYDDATDSYLASIRLYEELGDLNEQASLYGEFGYQLKRRDMDKANNYMRIAISIAERNKLGYLTSHKLYANYGVLKEMEGNLDSAMYFYNKTLVMNLQANDSLGLPYTYNKIAGINAMQGDYEEAYRNLNLSDDIRATEKGDFGRAENLSVRADILKSENRIAEAIEVYKRSLNTSKGIGYKYLIQYCSQNLKDLYEQIGNYKQALYYYDYYTNYTDSLTNLETDARIAELEISFETEKKDRIIAESNLAIEAKSRQVYITVGIALILALSSIGIYKYQKQKREQEKKKLELEKQLKEAELENKMSSEKLRISRELHDNIGSQLTFMISSLDNLSYTEKNEKMLTKLNRLSAFGRDTMKELRNTIWAMKHEDGDLSTLVIRLNELIHNLNQSTDNFKITINNSVDSDQKLSSSQMLSIFRIVQEAIQNTIKYAEASEVSIIIEGAESGFKLSIKDNGTGFDLQTVKKGNGLENMKHRCEEAGGVFSITSDTQGTINQCSFNNK